jgi:oligopeptide transport system substrate-binding protein
MRNPFGLTRRGTLISGLAGLSVAACGGRREVPPHLLRVAIGNMPDSLDPAIGQFAASALLYKQLFAPLTDYTDTLGVGPGLAEHWAVEDGGRRWIFTLREGLQWSDGHALTADDVVWSVQRILDPDTAGGQLGDFYAVENARAVLAGEMPPSEIGVRQIGTRQIEFRLDQASGLFPTLMREFYPFPRHAIETHGNDWVRSENFVGSGPFTLADTGALSFDLVRNPRNYAPARIASARVDIVDDASTRTRMFRAGEFDLAEAPPPTQIAMLRDQLGPQVQSFPAPKFTYLKLNLRRPHLQNPAVRQALSLAVDRGFLAEQIMAHTATPTETVIPSGNASINRHDMAIRVLADAGLTGLNAPRVILRTTSGERERLAIAIADDWQRAGIETELFASAPVDLYSAVDGGDFDVALSHFDRGLKTNPNFLMEPFSEGGFADDSGWFEEPSPTSERFSISVERARRAIRAEEQARFYGVAEYVLLDQQIIIPLLHEQAHWLVSNRVSGMTDGVQPQLWRRLDVQ